METRHGCVAVAFLSMVMLSLPIFSSLSPLPSSLSFIGAFQVGLVMPRRGNIIGQLSGKIEDICLVLFLPLYFASSGQKTDLKSINSGILWAITVCIIATATVGKLLGCVPAVKLLARFSWRDSFSFGVFMNTKGLVALVSLNLGLGALLVTCR